jgi:hypothetical protein
MYHDETRETSIIYSALAWRPELPLIFRFLDVW